MAGEFRPGIIFQRINSWTGSTSPWTGHACSVNRGPTAARTGGARARWRAHQSSASGRSGVPKLAGGGAKGREEHGELGSGLTGARVALWRPGDSGAEPRGGGAWCGHCSGVEREEKKRGKVWCYSGVVLAFYRGRGSTGEGWPGRLTPALMALTPLKTEEGLRGKLREGK
jgi:hypothetical protein